MSSRGLAIFLGYFRSSAEQTPRELPEPVQTELTELLQSALDQHNQGNVTHAITDYRRVLSEYPEHPDALHFLGVALAQEGRYAEAIAPLSRAADLQSDTAPVHNHYGHALCGLGAT